MAEITQALETPLYESHPMTEAQLYCTIGLPAAVASPASLVNIGYFVVLNGRISRLAAELQPARRRTPL
jgi:hypothetical protein